MGAHVVANESEDDEEYRLSGCGRGGGVIEREVDWRNNCSGESFFIKVELQS